MLHKLYIQNSYSAVYLRDVVCFRHTIVDILHTAVGNDDDDNDININNNLPYRTVMCVCC